ncbi:hypothetical protein Golax_000791 [Gossypium laxum]|uniref:Uncharacterized protein n=1 Tax=Gossypium laxum TaxID=34288 RepID=A0A7J9AWM3_9ROSI|nr:hypothetical protein [Gossypium laxum]
MDEDDNFYNSSDGLEQQIEYMEIKCYRAKEDKVKMIEELNLTLMSAQTMKVTGRDAPGNRSTSARFDDMATNRAL